ncbi:unnamed protein product [Brassica rapa subsp. trilocularis]
MERTIYTWIRKANNCFRGCSFTRSLDMACVFRTSRWYLSKLGYFCPIYSKSTRPESILICYISRRCS